MEIKRIIADCIKKTGDKMIYKATASAMSWGVEDMPQSMKEKR